MLVSQLHVYASPSHGQTMMTDRLHAANATPSTRDISLVLSHTHTRDLGVVYIIAVMADMICQPHAIAVDFRQHEPPSPSSAYCHAAWRIGAARAVGLFKGDRNSQRDNTQPRVVSRTCAGSEVVHAWYRLISLDAKPLF